MPGSPRIQYENDFYHAMNRGRGRRWIFHGAAYFSSIPTINKTKPIMTIPKENLLSDEPLTDASPIYQALWWIAKGEFKTGSEWDRAHDICQSDEGNKPYDWVHALVHWIEGEKT